MKFVAEIDVMPHKELLDPQGKTVANNLSHVNLSGIEDVRIGKHITLTLEADSEATARSTVETACQKLLANLIMENYTFSIKASE
ncbi:MAG: phosphoribosylformylglycinamidine synthase subunit PurS [Saprospiraceae bacterium]|nr:phosphoribosylformylglycinamidine synthase subunit PurS [Saprospiraceae bacterium]